MANQRLFPEPQKSDEADKGGSRKNFERIATKVFTVPKAEIDKREKEWREPSRRHEK